MVHGVLCLTLVLVLMGCAAGSRPSPSGTPAATAPPAATPPAVGSGCRSDEKLQRVCLADGFGVGGYEALYIAEAQAEVPGLNPDGKESLEWARGVLRDELAAAIRSRSLFTAVVTREADLKPGGRTLRLESTIIEYEKGGGGARYWAGLYGAGQPVIKVRGRMLDGDRRPWPSSWRPAARSSGGCRNTPRCPPGDGAGKARARSVNPTVRGRATRSDCDGVVERRFTKDELLTNVSIYWFTQTGDRPLRHRPLPPGGGVSAARVGRAGLRRDPLE